MITANAVIGAGADGIQVVSPGTPLKRNLLIRNAPHGIEAVAGVTDGGGNVAGPNGADPQRIRVVCR